MPGAQANLTVTVGAKDQTKAALDSATQSALRYAQAELEVAKKADQASAGATKAKTAQVSAAKQVALAIQQQANASDPLKSRLVELKRAHAELTARMTAMVKAGQPIPPSMARAAAEADRAAAAIKRQGAASRQSANSSAAMISSLKGMAAGYLGLMVVIPKVIGAMKSMIGQQIEEGDKLAKTSRQLGIGMQALQEFRYAADSGGSSVENMDKALAELNKKMGEAHLKSTAYADTFGLIGISIKDVRSLNTEQMFTRIADALANTEDQGVKTTVATRLFGEEGNKLITVLEGGAAGLEAMRQRSRELGGNMSDQLALDAEKASQAITDLNLAFKGLTNVAGVELIPKLTKLIGAFEILVRFINKNVDFFGGVFTRALEAIGGPIASVTYQVANLTGVLDDSAPSAELVASKLDDIEAKARDAATSADLLETSLRNVKAAEEGFDFSGQSGLVGTGELTEEGELVERSRVTEQKITGIVKTEAERRRAIRVSATTAAIENDNQRLESALNTATSMAGYFGQMYAAMNTKSEDSEKQFAKAALGMTKIALEFASQMIAMEAAKAGAAQMASASQYGLPGIAIGLAAAATVVGIIMGFMDSFAEGGIVRGGTQGKDSVPAWLMPGEMVLPVDVTRGILAAARQPSQYGMASGGVVPGGGGPGGNVTVNVQFQSLEVVDRAKARRVIRDGVMPAIRDLNSMGYE